MVLNKPAGLPVHAGPGHAPSVEDWFPQLSRHRNGPWLAHRLDADTAGCLAIALRKTALLEAQALFAAGRAEKTYWAIVRGHPGAASGTVDNRLAKRTSPAGWRMAPDPAGQTAITDWRVLGAASGLTWLELRPRTGRTHQIRVHCAALGCAIVGDPVYGPPGPPGPPGPVERLQLLARGLRLPLEPPVGATAPPPPHMAPALIRLGFTDPGDAA